MQESGPLMAKISGAEAILSSNFSVLTEAQDDKLKKKAHKNLVKKIHEIYKDATGKEIISSDFKDECPHCHKPQSWSISGMKSTMFNTAKAMLILGVMACAFFYFFYIVEGEEWAFIPAVPISAGIAVLIAVCSILMNMIKISSKSKKTSGSAQKMLPVIEWGYVQDLLDEPEK